MPRTALDYPPLPVGAVLAGAAQRYPDRLALTDGQEGLTYAELYDRALRFARGLHEHGIAPGETVLLMIPNCPWFPVAYWGTLLAGAVVSPTNPAQPAAPLAAQLADSDARAVIAYAGALPSVYAADAPGVRLTAVVPGPRSSPGALPEPPAGRTVLSAEELLTHGRAEPAGRRPEDVAHLAFTGGTTGRSKAVRVLHRNVIANVAQTVWVRAAGRLYDADGVLGLARDEAAATPHQSVPGTESTISVAPLFHAMGLVGMVAHTVIGTTAVLHTRFDPARYLDDIEAHQVAMVGGSPTMYRALLASPASNGRRLKSVRNINSGAAPMDSGTRQRLTELFPDALYSEGYGLTEATMALAMWPLDAAAGTPHGTVGVALPDTELSIRDLLDPERELPVGETGELWARGPQVTDGYQGHPELTAEQYAGGWLRTGDIGRLDERGHLFLSGRAKDMLIYKGYNVYPLHLEDILAGHPAVAAVAVIGAPAADAGEIPAAYVVLRNGAAATADELMGYVAERVAPYQRVRELHFTDALPVSAAGKVLKTALRERHAARTAE
ncbi:class I adenylate-forming enzyme family protein [Streptomyces ochraceiscleroticus]|uniref:Class I adenylate-forming enzyme family protein n=1 Tax=Streptomyces ochraceiscleroticus TaxID=47761 RepID=A0ABW1MJB0_9ACTN|nr:AMP-binding protein [Streptomyces ochraceiscleroticus]